MISENYALESLLFGRGRCDKLSHQWCSPFSTVGKKYQIGPEKVGGGKKKKKGKGKVEGEIKVY